jgi:hypothetical protein
MDFSLSPEQSAFRSEVREFIEKELPPEWKWGKLAYYFFGDYERVGSFTRTMAQKLGANGWLSLTWPKEYGGQDASPIFQLILMEELEYHHCPGFDTFGVGMVAPTLIRLGTEEQKREHLPPIAKGERFWCECLSEPDAGSDLASLRTRAIEEDDEFVINGQKAWTSGAHQADWGILLARTDTELPKHRGLSFFLIDMKAEGITINPLINIVGEHEFNEVFFDNVRVPKGNLVGVKNQGWRVVMTLLDFERSTALPYYAGARQYLEELIEHARRQTRPLNPASKNCLSELIVECEVSRLLTYRAAWMGEKGLPFTPEAAMAKLYSVELIQRVANAGMNLLGLYSQLTESSKQALLDGRARWHYLRSAGITLEAGSSEIDRNLIAMRGLGLPGG